jgi:DNA-binding winged helix-turn-helix (wHTH) protein/Tfp pilus assembly protein PilF
MLYRFSSFDLDSDSMTLRAAGRTVELPKRAVETLAILVARRGAVVTKIQLMDALWPDGFVEEANLTQYIYLLRRALREHGLTGVIETHPRRGYSFNPPHEITRTLGFARLAGVLASVMVLLIIAGANRIPVASQSRLGAEAMQAYSLGRYFWNLRSVAGMQRSISYFRRVIALAPGSPLGYAALADAYTELADLEAPCRQCVAWGKRARLAAEEALAADFSSPEAHVAYGMIARVFDHDDRTAAHEFRLALARDPNDALANQWYGNLLVAEGEPGEGVRYLQIAVREEPISTATYAWLARAYYYERRYTQARVYALDALSLQPGRLETVILLGLIEESVGNYRSAFNEFALASRLGMTATESQALRAGIYAAMGRRDVAIAALERLALRRNLDIYTVRDVAIGFMLSQDVPAAKALLSRTRYPTVLDRELLVQDPHLRSAVTL